MAAEGSVVSAAAGEHETPQHDYHLVNPSPWPLVGSISGLFLTTGGVLWMHGLTLLGISGKLIVLLGAIGVITTMVGWWRDVIRESGHGDHKPVVNRGLRMGMVLFIVSEVFFFFAFFWAFFWGALNPPMTVATTWPPEGIEPVPTWQLPFMNTLILLSSGAAVTWAHHALREGHQEVAAKALALTVALGIAFTGFQAFEYYEALHEGFNMTSGIYGSTFYMATGFHGFHVIVGTTFLIVCMMRAYYANFRSDKHVGFESAAWYWHFVDVVWLFLFVWVYWWGGSLEFTTQPVG